MPNLSFKTADVAGVRVFYREAGDPSKPTIVLLHETCFPCHNACERSRLCLHPLRTL